MNSDVRISPAPLVAHDSVTTVGYAAVVGAIVVSWALDVVPTGLADQIGLAVAVLFLAAGTPHGALDHLAVGAEFRRRSRFDVGFVVAYVGLAAACLVGYLINPPLGFAAFLVLSVVHFAAGEAGVALDRGAGRHWWDVRPVTAALAGATVLLVPLSSTAAHSAVVAVDPRLTPMVDALDRPATVVFALLAVGIVWCAVLAIRGSVGARRVVIDAMALGLLAALADPVLAFAAFYAAWHALRHQARLADQAGAWSVADSTEAAGPLTTIARSALPGLPATVGVVAVAVVLAVTGLSALGALLAVVWALTVPHAVAVAWLEWRRAQGRRSRHAVLLP